jgi:hypothetical protein
MGNEAKVISSLAAFARQLGINVFWREWSEAQFELDDSNSKIEDIVWSSWPLNGARWNAAAFYALQPAMRENRAVRLAASKLDGLAHHAFFEAAKVARKHRAKIPPKIELTSLRVFSGTKPVEVTPIETLKPLFAKDVPKRKAPPVTPDVLWGRPLTRRAQLEIADRLYEDVLDVLGPPSSVDPLETCQVFSARWQRHKVMAAIHPVGFAVLRVVLQATKSD